MFIHKIILKPMDIRVYYKHMHYTKKQIAITFAILAVVLIGIYTILKLTTMHPTPVSQTVQIPPLSGEEKALAEKSFAAKPAPLSKKDETSAKQILVSTSSPKHFSEPEQALSKKILGI